MSTLTASATALAWRRSDTSWNSEGAMQGRYGGQGARTGAMKFATLRSVDWSNQRIIGIRLTLTFDRVGTNAAKLVSLYRGARDTISGSPEDMRGEAIGSFSISGAYNAVRTALFSETANAAAFAALADWLQNGGTSTLVMYRSESAGSPGWSDNYLRVAAAELRIDYEVAGSGGQLDCEEVDAGEAVTLTVSPLPTDGALTHRVEWRFGSHSAVQQLAQGETGTAFAPPPEWLDAIPDAASGPAACRLTTFVDGAERGSRTLAFTIRAPASAAPDFEAEIVPWSERVSGAADYYQYLTGAIVRASEAAAKHGASIASVAISGGEGESASGAELRTPYFAAPGMHVYTLAVTDSRGLRTIRSASCTVRAVALPAVSRFSVERYSAATDAPGQYVRTDYGPNVWVTLDATWDTAGGLNPAEAYLLYGIAGSAERTRVELSPSGGALSLDESRAVIPGEISTEHAWVFELYLSDAANATGAADSVARGRCNAHFAGSGYGVAFGGFAKGVEASPLLESYYPVQLYEALNVDGPAAFGGEVTGINDAVLAPTGAESTCGSIASGAWPSYTAFVAEKAGLYLFGVNVSFAHNSSGDRRLYVFAKRANGDADAALWYVTHRAASGASHRESAVCAASLAAGDSIVWQPYQNAGAGLEVRYRSWAIRLK